MIDTAAAAPSAAVGAPGRVIHWTRTCAALVLGFAAIGVWWPVLGAGTLWIVPVLVLTSFVAGDVIELRSRRLAVAFPWLWLAWTPVAFIVAGLPAWALNPLELAQTMRELASALAVALRTPNAVSDSDGPWLLAAWLHLCGMCWFVAAAQSRRGTRGAAASAFFLLAIPFALSLAFGQTGDAAWQGGAILVAGLLWATRGNLRDGLPALAVVAAVGVAVAALVAPTERWSGLDPQNANKPKFSALSSEQTYGPSNDRKTGQTVLRIRSEKPALWRMEVLHWFDGRVWRVAEGPGYPELSQPSAKRTTTTVTNEGLLNELAVGPGRIVSAAGNGIVGTRRAGNEAVALMPRPRRGQSYAVVSDEVPISPELANVKVPSGSKYADLTQVAPPGSDFPNPAVGNLTPEQLQTGYGQVASIAEQLSRGTTSQLEIVERVNDYLTANSLFTYSLDVEQPGPYPLLDFLLETRKGYCQHFAGAAALLLRLNGIPTRVVTGFATGKRSGDGEWDVRDKDAHAWIEVYFPRHGWVAFNPTPPAAEAAVAPGVGEAEKKRDAALSGTKIPVLPALAVIVVVLAIFWAVRRSGRPRREPDPLGDVLAGIVPAPAGPAMTFEELRDDLRELGPAVTALADEAERQRFGPSGTPPEPRPRRRVWRALIADVGPVRAARILLLGPGRRPITDSAGPKITSSGPPASVAPPGAPPA